jgi:high affinity Mn2+ porin
MTFCAVASAQEPPARPSEPAPIVPLQPNDAKPEEKKDENPAPDWYNLHGQTTLVPQGNFPFRSPYQGDFSLDPSQKYRATATTTLFMVARPFTNSEIVFNPELSAGGGLGNPTNGTVGIAGFPNGEATRTGAPQPTPYIARLFWKQTIGLGGEQETIEEGPNALAGKVDVNRITVRIGKMSAGDLFDDNAYSHDPRTQFMNWGLMYNGAWDYAANVRGYTYGGGVEWNTKLWSFRYGVFAEPAVANGAAFDPHIVRANANTWEIERRWKINERPGALSFLSYLNNAHMGSYRESIALGQQQGTTPDITATREYRIKYGFGLNLEQELTDDVGLFSRLGWNDGQTETWAFTEIDRTASIGIQIKGTRWKRPDDRLGYALLVNGLSDAHRDYLAAGGVGFIVGDGRLNYAPEQIFETYYNIQLKKGVVLGLGFTGVANPGYNQDRGPVAIGTVRFHYEF